jgi:hypothetical protein
MHLTEEQLQRLLHGEESSQAVANHVAGCLECHALVDQARQDEGEIFDLLRAVDIEPPGLDAEALASLARVRRRRPPQSRYRWAAGIVLVGLLGGVAYALPGSPLKAWLTAMLSSRREVSLPPDSTAGTPETPVAVSGIAVDPGGMLVIVFEASPPGARVRVTITDDAQVMVQAPIGQARFTSEMDRLLIAVDGESTEVEIRIPRSAPRVEILVDTRRLLAKTGMAIVAALSPERDSSYLLPLSP